MQTTQKSAPYPLLTISLFLSAGLIVKAATPVLVPQGAWSEVHGDIIEEIAAADRYAYLANGFAGLQIIDITVPQTPVQVSRLQLPGLARAVAVEDGMACVADWQKGLHLIDVSNPETPLLKGTYESSLLLDVSMTQTHAYAADCDDGIRIVDIGDPERPVLAGHFQMSRCNALAMQGTYVFAAGLAGGLLVLDVSDPEHPIRVADYQGDSAPVHEVAISGQHAYLISHMVEVIDISNPKDPTRVGQVKVETGNYLAATDQYLVVGDTRGSLHLLSVLDPAQPAIVSSYASAEEPREGSRRPLAFNGLFYWPNGEHGIEILSVELAPDLSIARLVDGSLRVSWDLAPQTRLEQTSNLDNPQWEEVPDTADSGHDITSKKQPSLFFRAVRNEP